jgi:Plasmid recombination enzyme
VRKWEGEIKWAMQSFTWWK